MGPDAHLQKLCIILHCSFIVQIGQLENGTDMFKLSRRKCLMKVDRGRQIERARA